MLKSVRMALKICTPCSINAGNMQGFERGHPTTGRPCEYAGYFTVNSLNRCSSIIII